MKSALFLILFSFSSLALAQNGPGLPYLRDDGTVVQAHDDSSSMFQLENSDKLYNAATTPYFESALPSPLGGGQKPAIEADNKKSKRGVRAQSQ